MRRIGAGATLCLWLLPAGSTAAPWSQDTGFDALDANGNSAKGDAADLDGDGTVDLVFANTFGYNKGDPMGSDQPQQAFLNTGGGSMTDVSDTIFGAGQLFNGRAVKLRDLDGDGDNDIILGTTWISQSQLFLNDGAGNFTNETATHLPEMLASIGDVEVGDVDDDGDLDLALANWGSDPIDEQADHTDAGGVTLLWGQVGIMTEVGSVGTGMFEDLTPANMPNIELRWSWDLEFVDIDNDWDLDLVISCFSCDKSVYIFGNDGAGKFGNLLVDNIAGKGAPDIEPIDLTGDGFLDLVTLQDGTNRRNRVLVNNGNGGYTINSDDIWPNLHNPTAFDFAGAFYDYDSDQDPDLVLGAFQTATKYPDRLMVNDGGKLSQWDGGGLPKYQALEHVPNPTNASPGTYHIVLADFNGDHRLDVAMAQAENAADKLVFFATDEVAVDTAPPIIVNTEDMAPLQYGQPASIRVRCHDNKSPLMLHDFTQTDGSPHVESWSEDPGDPVQVPGEKSNPGQWYGEYLWRIGFEVPDSAVFYYRICAVDAAGNKNCTAVVNVPVEGGGTDGETSQTDADTDTDTSPFTGDTNSDTLTVGSDSMSGSSAPTGSSSTGIGDTVPTTDSVSETDTDSDTADSTAAQLDDDGCACRSDRGGLPFVSVLLVLARVRRRPGAAGGAPLRTSGLGERQA